MTQKQLKSIRRVTGFALLTAMVLMVLLSVYPALETSNNRGDLTRTEYIAGIDTPVKKWLNGYLGVFFRFEGFGNINWLVLPLLAWFFIAYPQRDRKQSALVLVWFLTTLLMVFKGYDNARYQLTLFPMTVAAVLYLLWLFLENKTKIPRVLCLSFVALLCVYNIYHHWEKYTNQWHMRVTAEKPRFPHKLVDYINNAGDIDQKNRVFTINTPLFYYHTDKPGLDYMHPDGAQAWGKMWYVLGNRQKLFRNLTRRRRVRYILVKSMHLRFYRGSILQEFLHCETRPVMEDNGWSLFKLREQPLKQHLRRPEYRRLWTWKPIKGDTAAVSPSLVRFHRRGIYSFEVKPFTGGKKKGQNKYIPFIEIRNTRVKPRYANERRINFGYELGKKGLQEKIPAGKYAHFIVRILISPRLLNNQNAIYVLDYDGKKWEQSKQTFFSNRWRTYVVSKKIRPGAKRVRFMIRFSPVD